MRFRWNSPRPAPAGRRRLWRGLTALAVALATAGSALAQLPAPQLPTQLPPLPDAGQVVRGAASDLEAKVPLDEVRKLNLRNLVLGNRRTLEMERGEVIVRHEVLAIAPTEEALAAARGAGFDVAAREALDGLESSIVTLRAPERMSTRRALERLRALDPTGVYDFNHIYSESGPETTTPAPVARGGTARVGLIDGGVPENHPAFSRVRVHARAFAGAPTPSAHGVAVASILTSSAPVGTLYAADVYGGAPTGGSASAIARAFSWMAQERVTVINVSLVGPSNRALEAIVNGMTTRGFLIVAAVGNDGPAAPPLYPAAYPGVIGVTGVSARGRVLVEAARGPQVDFAAPGADVAAAGIDGAGRSVRGTSFAAPIVAGLLAARANAPGPDAQRAVRELEASAEDLGARGRDDIYGMGLVGRDRLAAR